MKIDWKNLFYPQSAKAWKAQALGASFMLLIATVLYFLQ
jgi:hypothetical protein